MTRRCIAIAAALGIAAVGSPASVRADPAKPPATAAAGDLSGLHDFDFEVGTWRVRHRVKRADEPRWREFTGTCNMRTLMAGAANVEEHRFDRPTGSTYGVALRAYDAKTAEWAIWWVDSRVPHGPVDPPAKGRFKNGVGTFYSDVMLDGKPLRTRLVWSHITPTSARWEQANSYDGGKTWEPNWTMEFQRTAARPPSQ